MRVQTKADFRKSLQNMSREDKVTLLSKLTEDKMQSRAMFAAQNPFSSPNSSIKKSRTVTATGTRKMGMSPSKVGIAKMDTIGKNIYKVEPQLRKNVTTYEQAVKKRPQSSSPTKHYSGDKYVKYFSDLVQPQHKMDKAETIA